MSIGSRVSPFVRLAAIDDADAISKVLQAAFVEFEPLYTPGGFSATVLSGETIKNRWNEGPVWVALIGEEVVGTVTARPEGDSCYVRSMAVRPDARGLGVGNMLLEQLESHALKTVCKRLYLTTTPFLTSAIRLYETFGFRDADQPTDLFGTPLITMEKLHQG